MTAAQVVEIDRSATTFTAVCLDCGVSFAGRLDADLDRGVFLCRAGHAIEIVRTTSDADSVSSGEAAA